MIRVRGLISSIKASVLTNKNAFPHKIQESWDREFNQENPKINYLQKLLESNTIRPYFIEKDIKELEKEDIYFFMENKQIFHKLPPTTKQQLIKNPNASTILKFHLAEEINALKSEEVQKHLLHSFNKELSSLNINDVVFCLEIICDFKDVSEDVNYYELEKKVIQQKNSEIFIKLIYYLSQLQFELEMVTTQLIKTKIDSFNNFSLENILYIKKIAQFYDFQLSTPVQERLRTSFINNRVNFDEENGNFIVELLRYYPESVNALNIQCFLAQDYITYLQLFDSEQGIKQIPKAIHHPISKKVIKNAQVYQFSQIIQKRINLQIDKMEDIIANLKDYYTSELNCIIAIIRYLEKQQKLTPQFQSVIEKSLAAKILKIGEKAYDEFKIVDIFKLFGYLSINNLGTINFWKKCLKFVTAGIEDSSNYKNLSGDEQKKFVVYLFQIFKNKPFPIELQDQIINLTLLSLTINKWSIRQILPLTISLKVNKIADNQLWLGIEQRINQMNIRNIESQSDRKALRKIVYNFNAIGKGSFGFWNEINRKLHKKQKLQILNHFKIPSTLAHTYLKI